MLIIGTVRGQSGSMILIRNKGVKPIKSGGRFPFTRFSKSICVSLNLLKNKHQLIDDLRQDPGGPQFAGIGDEQGHCISRVCPFELRARGVSI